MDSFTLSYSFTASSSSLPFFQPPIQPPNPAAIIFLVPRSGRKGLRFEATAAGRKRYKGTAMREAALDDLIERMLAEAKEACGGDGAEAVLEAEGCRVAWDQVEEVSQAKADFRRRIAQSPSDPLEPFCRDHPEADECAVVIDDRHQ